MVLAQAMARVEWAQLEAAASAEEEAEAVWPQLSSISFVPLATSSSLLLFFLHALLVFSRLLRFSYLL